MLDFFPLQLKKIILSHIEIVYEVRVRTNGTITVCGCNNGIKINKSINYNLSLKDIERMVFALSDYSIYSKEESLKRGVIISREGERVGICGEIVCDEKGVVTIKNFVNFLFYIFLRYKNRSCVIILHEINS